MTCPRRERMRSGGSAILAARPVQGCVEAQQKSKRQQASLDNSVAPRNEPLSQITCARDSAPNDLWTSDSARTGFNTPPHRDMRSRRHNCYLPNCCICVGAPSLLCLPSSPSHSACRAPSSSAAKPRSPFLWVLCGLVGTRAETREDGQLTRFDRRRWGERPHQGLPNIYSWRQSCDVRMSDRLNSKQNLPGKDSCVCVSVLQRERDERDERATTATLRRKGGPRTSRGRRPARLRV